MGKPRIVVPALDPVADLKRRLARAATDQARAFWTRHLKGAARVRGVPMAKVRSNVQAWWRDHGFGDHPATVGKRIALALIAQRMTEDKVAGMLVLEDILGEQLRVTDLPAFAELFDDGHLADPTVVDWFATKVLGTMLSRSAGRGEVARQLARWKDAESMWQRRAACLAFVELAPEGDAAMPGFVTLVLALSATVVWSHERFDQLAVGTLLRELSRAEPARVLAFYKKHAHLMSKECARTVIARLPKAERAELLAHHTRVTTLKNDR